MISPACEAAREALPLLLEEGPADARIASHLAACPSCSVELGSLREVLAALEASAREPVPDPGDSYWQGFGGSVRRRLDARDPLRALAGMPRRGLPAALRAAAAVLLMACAASAALWWSPDPRRAGTVTEAELAEALRAAVRAGGAEVEAYGVELESTEEGTDPVPEVGPESVLEALRDTGTPPGLMGLWDDAEFESWVLELDAGMARRLLEG